MAEQLHPDLPELDPDGSAAYWRQKEQELKTPFKGLLPPLSTEEKESLVASIRQYGVTHPVVIDEEGNILDGHHRHSVDPNAPTVVMPGLSQLEKQAFVMSTNDTRRNMSPEQRRELRKSQQKLCLQLKKDDPNRWTQEELSTLFAKAITKLPATTNTYASERVATPRSANTMLFTYANTISEEDASRVIAANTITVTVFTMREDASRRTAMRFICQKICVRFL